MVYSLTWLPAVLEKAGLKVSETEGWRSRGRAEMGKVRGVMCHHTATVSTKNMPTLGFLIKGSAKLPGPLCQLGLGRDGTFYVVAAGRANHAGGGVWEGIKTGNSSFIGIEAENSGAKDDPWPDVQMDAYRRGVAAILREIGAGANMCCGHKEYRLPKGKKVDPSFDMAAFRSDVAELLAGRTTTIRPPIPANDSKQRPTLRRGARGDLVRLIQKAVNADVDGAFEGGTEAAVRAFQRGKKDVDGKPIVPDGIVGPKTWALIDAAPGAAAPQSAAGALPIADDAAHKPKVSGKKGIAADGVTEFADVEKSGFQILKGTTLAKWRKASGITAADCLFNILSVTTANEGRFESVNSYDNQFMSFGIMQWTAGNGGDGELGALLHYIAQTEPAAFQECFGRFGLTAKGKLGRMTGAVLIDGKALKTNADKEQLRSVIWAYRFWRAGHHPAIRLRQFEFAASRVHLFEDKEIQGMAVSAWVTSEYAVAQLLDEHINRPAHVPGTLERALIKLKLDEKTDVSAWTMANEQALIDEYIAQRNARTVDPMTDSEKRAKAIREMMNDKKLSGERGSFDWSEV